MPLPSLPAGLATRADAIMADALAQLRAAQSLSDHAGQRVYRQLPWTSTEVPADNSTRAIDLRSSVGDRSDTWEAIGITTLGGQAHGEGLRIRLAVHEYLGPDGAGWVLLGQVEVSGQLWQRVVHGAGPEAWRAYDWTEVASAIA